MDVKILLVDDDLLEAEKLQASLQRAGFVVQVASPSRKAIRLARTQKPSLIVLGLNGHGNSHPHFDQSMRRAAGSAHLILIPPEGADVPPAENQKVLPRPITTRKVMYHVRRALRANEPATLRLGDMVLDYENQCVWKEGEKHILTPKTFKLLEFFMARPGQVLSRREIMIGVWDTSYTGDIRTLYVHVRWLRKKLEPVPSKPRYIRTVRGIGYLFDVPVSK
jgi:two-component system alkaline phosphatase synthesis response regulator PhoP